MRYPDGGGLTALARARREEVRMQAAELFAQGVSAEEIAARLRVSTKSVYQWRRRWTAGGEQALVSLGQGGPGSKLTEEQCAPQPAPSFTSIR